MSIGREYQNSLMESLRVSKNKRTNRESDIRKDDQLLEHLEYQANVRALLGVELEKPSAKKRLGEYCLQITSGSYFDAVSRFVDSRATGNNESQEDAVDSIKSDDVESVSGSIIKLSTLDLEVNQLAIDDLLRNMHKDSSIDNSINIELISRISNPGNSVLSNDIFSSSIFALDRLAAAKRNVFIGIGRSVSLLDAIETDSFLEIDFERGIRATSLPSHNLLVPIVPSAQESLSLPQAALNILDKDGFPY